MTDRVSIAPLAPMTAISAVGQALPINIRNTIAILAHSRYKPRAIDIVD